MAASHTSVSVDGSNDPASKSWKDAEHGPALYRFESQEIVPGQPMSLELVQRLFSRLASVNMCPCRELEEMEVGWNSILSTAVSYVTKDLVYDKEHAKLKNKAEAWSSAVENGTPKSLLQDEEANFWAEWLVSADKYNLEPRPSENMRTYVAASKRQSASKKRTMRLLGLSLVLVLVAASVISSVMAVTSVQARNAEAESARRATESARRATEALQDAEEARARAEEARAEAVMSSRLSLASATSSLLNPNDYVNGWELALAREATARLPVPGAVGAEINNTLRQAVQTLFLKPYGYLTQVRALRKPGPFCLC